MYPNRIKEEIKRRGYTFKEVARALYISERALRNYCAGRRPMPKDLRERLATLLECSVPELLTSPSSCGSQQPSSSCGQARFDGPAGLPDIMEQASDKSVWCAMNSLRRQVLMAFSGIIGAGFIPSSQHALLDPFPGEHEPVLSEISLQNLAAITHQFRIMQRQGDTFIIKGLLGHIATIEEALYRTKQDIIRRELWRLLAQAQLVARLHPIQKLGLAQAKTLNEAAIASAINSGDLALTGAAIGHLAHLYLREERNLHKASQLLDQAWDYSQESRDLRGWIAIVRASIAAHQGDLQKCEVHIAEAMEIADSLSGSQRHPDPYFTDFSRLSVQIFAGNCWLTLGASERAYKLLTASPVEELSMNRHASAHYDLARASIVVGEIEAAQRHAFKAMDLAQAMEQEYVIHRCIALAHSIQHRNRCKPLAQAVIEYAHTIQRRRINNL
jgi:transcriptional regulator with XRE-family HTH domain